MDITYTKEELRKFARLVDQVSSRDQMKRIQGRLAQRRFVNEHGKEKCDAMWAELQKRGNKRIA